LANDIITSEAWECSYDVETTPGTPVSATRILGLFDRATLADPEIEMTPFYGAGGYQARGWYKMVRGKWTLTASFSDVIMLSAHPLYLPFGTKTEISGGYTFTEAGRIPSITLVAQYWNIQGEAQLIRRYVGGKVGRFTISCDEGEPAKISLEDVTFLDIQHNVPGIPKYDATVTAPTIPCVSLEPFYFHGGALTLAGNEFGRVKGFKLEINNNVEGNYYWKTGEPFMPSYIQEHQREYVMTVRVDIEDNALFEEILRAGEYDDGFTGFATTFKLARSETDYIEITAPTGTLGPCNQGCFIRKGKLDIVTDPLVTQELDILCRKPQVTVMTSETY
jgi:hypothetical protein